MKKDHHVAEFRDGKGGFTYICTRQEMANIPVRRRGYRCVRCYMVTPSKWRMRWHVMWRWLREPNRVHPEIVAERIAAAEAELGFES